MYIFSDDCPKSPILKAKRRTSPILVRKRRNIEKEADFKTPEKQMPNLSHNSSSPVFAAKRRKGQVSRGKVHIIEIASQNRQEEICDIISDSPVRIQEASQSSYINLSNSPMIKIKKPRPCNRDQLGVTVGKNCTKVVCSRENFEIVDASQESRGAEHPPDCSSTQDGKKVAVKSFSDKVHLNYSL